MEILALLVITLSVGYWVGKWAGKEEYKSKSELMDDHKNDQVSLPNSPAPAPKPSIPPTLNVEKAVIDDIQLSEEQQAIFKAIETDNVTAYVTGKAGTGKSVLLQYFVKHTSKNVVVVAPTGVAALNVGGQTIHSFFKLAPELLKLDELQVDYKTKEILRHIDTLVIDEISMVNANLLEAMNVKLQLAKGNELPFGGIQMVMFGDLFQLPPVVQDGELRRYFDHNYGGIYFFHAPVYKTLNLKIFELEHIFRQKDGEFIELLNTIRDGQHTEEIMEKLNQRAGLELPDGGFITLAGNNATVSRINHHKLMKLAGEEKTYEAEITGNIKESSFPTEKFLKLKVGAQVMLLKNDRQKPPRWVNGTLAVITKLSDDVIRVNIDGVEHSVSKESWDSIRYEYNSEERKLDKHIVSSFTQFPLRLAWAITIHKSQGQTYQSVAIDLSDGAFAHGQTYVALSRCVALDTLFLLSSVRSEDIIVDQDIVEFMKNSENFAS